MPDEYVFSAEECRLILLTYCDLPPALGECDKCEGAPRCRLRRMAVQASKYADMMKRDFLFQTHPATTEDDSDRRFNPEEDKNV